MKVVTENYGDSELAQRFGVTRYPAIFVEDVLVAKPKDFGFYGKGEGPDEGRYTPWKDAGNHEKFRTDLRKMIQVVLAGQKSTLQNAAEIPDEELKTLPSFEAKTLDGNPVSSSSLAGKVVLVEFWATWCPPCRGTLNWLGKLQKEYGDQLTVVSIAIESEEKDVRDVSKSQQLPIQWVMGTPEIARSFGDINSVPTLFLFGKDGKTIKVFYGAPEELHSDAEKVLASLLK